MATIIAQVKLCTVEVTTVNGLGERVAACRLVTPAGRMVSWAGQLCGESTVPATFLSSTAARTFARAHGIEVAA